MFCSVLSQEICGRGEDVSETHCETQSCFAMCFKREGCRLVWSNLVMLLSNLYCLQSFFFIFMLFSLSLVYFIEEKYILIKLNQLVNNPSKYAI